MGSYIGFEERVLYNEIRAIASPEQWEEIEKSHHQLEFNDDYWEDRFWEASID